MFGLSISFWIAMAVLIIAGVIKLKMYFDEKASKKRVAEMEKELNTPSTLGINVGESIETEEKI